MEDLFTVNDLHKSFGTKRVLRGISFSVKKGEILGIVGKSGAGKSTLLNIMSGITETYDSGEVAFNSTIIEGERAKDIGFSFQPYSFYEDLTLWDNLVYFGRLYDMPITKIRSQAETLLKICDFHEDDLQRYPKRFSGGMKKRFDIMCSLLHDPAVLILDEPTAGLDPLRRKQAINVIKRVNGTGVTIIIATHLMNDIEELCDRVLLMDKGKDLVVDTPDKIRDELMEYERITITSNPGNYEPIIKTLQGFSIMQAEEQKGKLIIDCPETEVLVHFILHILEKFGEQLMNITIEEPNLSNMFVLLENKGKNQVLYEHINHINGFIHQLIGKKYPPSKIKEIFKTHKWPDEVVEVLVGKNLVERSVKDR